MKQIATQQGSDRALLVPDGADPGESDETPAAVADGEEIIEAGVTADAVLARGYWVPDEDDDPAVDGDPFGALEGKASWVPYEGPKGGTGWRNAETGDVVYDDEPPGEVGIQSMSDEELVAAARSRLHPSTIDDADGRDELRSALARSLGAEGEGATGDLGRAMEEGDPAAWDPDAGADDLDTGDEISYRANGSYHTAEIVQAPDAADFDYQTALGHAVGADDLSSFPGQGETDGPPFEEGEIVSTGTSFGEVVRVSRDGDGAYVDMTGDGEYDDLLSDYQLERVETDRLGDAGGATYRADELTAGDEVYIGGEPAEVSTIKDMGGGLYVAGRTDDGDVVTARVGPDAEFDGVGDPEPTGDLSAGDNARGPDGGLVRIEDVTAASDPANGCPSGEDEYEDVNGRTYCAGELEEHPGYDTTGGFDEKLAKHVERGDAMGTDAIYRNMGKVDDPDLVADALELELRGKDRKTARERLESKLGTLGGDPADVRARLRETGGPEAPPDPGGTVDPSDATFGALRGALGLAVREGDVDQPVAKQVLRLNTEAGDVIESLENEGLLGEVGEKLEVDEGYPGDFPNAEVELAAMSNNAREYAGTYSVYDGRSGYDLGAIERLHENATTEELEVALGDSSLQARERFDNEASSLIQGLLHYRDDSVIDWEEATGFDESNASRAAASANEVRRRARESFDDLDPAVGALTMTQISTFELASLDGSTIGRWRNSPQTLQVDSDGTGASTTKHEIGHALQYALGVTGEAGRDNTDSHRKNDPDSWDFDVQSSGDPHADEIAGELDERIEAWRDRAARHGTYGTECRQYQRTNANEYVAVTFAHWQSDRAKLENKDPEMADFWDRRAGGGAREAEPVDVPEPADGDGVAMTTGKAPEGEVPDGVEGERVNVTTTGGEEIRNWEADGINEHGVLLGAARDERSFEWDDVAEMEVIQ